MNQQDEKVTPELQVQENNPAGEAVPGKKPRFRIWKVLALVLPVLLLLGCLFPLLSKDSGLPKKEDSGVVQTVPVQGKTAENYNEVYKALLEVSERQAEYNEYNGDIMMEAATANDAMTGAGEAQKSAAAPMAGAETGTRTDESYGKTNVQVEGVDEGDIVKNDGQYLYILSELANGQYLSIVKASDMKLVLQAKIEGNFYARDLYVYGDRLAVIGQQLGEIGDDAGEANDDVVKDYFFYQDGNTCVRIYDISDRRKIELVREFTQEGGYRSSRLVGGNLYLVSQDHVYDLADIKPSTVEDYLPHTTDSAIDPVARPVSAGCIAIAREPDSTFTVVSALDITGNEAANTQTALGSYGGEVYSTPATLYVVGSNSKGVEVMKYKLSDGSIRYEHRTEVPGFINNQFSMDEYNGYFRIATTSYVTYQEQDVVSWSEETRNNLYILDGELNQVGKVEGLAKGETIQSVRFMQDMAYVVTFRQTDPLFAIDVSDPTNPTVLGQLKIPGFSRYMHPIDENTLLGIGYDADEETGGTTGLKLSLFDVSDPRNPKETHKLLFSGGCDSAATYDHKAVTYIEEDGLLCLPIQVWDTVKVAGKTLGYQYDGAAVLVTVDKNSGFQLKAALTDPKKDRDNYYRYIHRTTYIGNSFYTISNRSVIQFDRQSIERIAQLDLQ